MILKTGAKLWAFMGVIHRSNHLIPNHDFKDWGKALSLHGGYTPIWLSLVIDRHNYPWVTNILDSFSKKENLINAPFITKNKTLILTRLVTMLSQWWSIYISSNRQHIFRLVKMLSIWWSICYSYRTELTYSVYCLDISWGHETNRFLGKKKYWE